MHFELLRSVSAHEGVRIVAFGERHDTHRDAAPEKLVAGAEGGALPCLITVVDDECLFGVARDQLSLFGGQRRSEGRDDGVNAGCYEAHHVEVALDHYYALVAPDRKLGPVGPIQDASLGEDRRLGRVDVLDLSGTQIRRPPKPTV